MLLLCLHSLRVGPPEILHPGDLICLTLVLAPYTVSEAEHCPEPFKVQEVVVSVVSHWLPLHLLATSIKFK